MIQITPGNQRDFVPGSIRSLTGILRSKRPEVYPPQRLGALK